MSLLVWTKRAYICTDLMKDISVKHLKGQCNYFDTNISFLIYSNCCVTEVVDQYDFYIVVSIRDVVHIVAIQLCPAAHLLNLAITKIRDTLFCISYTTKLGVISFQHGGEHSLTCSAPRVSHGAVKHFVFFCSILQKFGLK